MKSFVYKCGGNLIMSLLITKQNNAKLQYDTLAKKVLSHKEILAYIMKNVLEEYRNETIDDIIHK